MDRAVASDDVMPAGPERTAAVITALFREHHLELVRVALVMVGDLAAAEDVVQDAFERMHRRRHGLRDEDGGMVGYARKAVLNGCRALHRHAAVIRKHEPELAGRAVDSYADAAAEIGDRDQIIAAMRALPRRQREVLVLRYYCDLDVGEVAATLRIAPGRVPLRRDAADGSLPCHAAGTALGGSSPC